MTTLNDAILAATGGPTINDGLSTFYGRTDDETLNDAEYRWLTEQGVPPTQLNDMWFALLRDLGYTGALNDMKLAFWSNGGAIPLNLYVNPEFAGGGVDTPCTSHSLTFNTNSCDYVAIPNTNPQAFEFISNTQDIDGRSVQSYNLGANNPDLQVGRKYRIQYEVQSLNGRSYSAAVTVNGNSNLTVSEVQRACPSSGNAIVFYEFTVDALPYSGDLRVGCGTTANNLIQMAVRKPRLIDITPSLVTAQVLTVGQFPNINKRGYRNPSIGSIVPATNPQFNIEELLINAGTGKLVLRGVETAPWSRIEVDGVPFLKANATFDGFDTWRWSTPVTWLVGTDHTVTFVG